MEINLSDKNILSLCLRITITALSLTLVLFLHLEKLIANLKGTIVIAADHGESFGKMGVYGHPPLMLMKDLYLIPWLVIEK
jgi:hypothetical protein